MRIENSFRDLLKTPSMKKEVSYRISGRYIMCVFQLSLQKILFFLNAANKDLETSTTEISLLRSVEMLCHVAKE